MNEIEIRDEFTRKRVNAVRRELAASIDFAKSDACVYATGSYGRCEASEHSDLDVFIVGVTRTTPDEQGSSRKERSLSRLDEILVKAELIKLSKAYGYPKFSKDGKYLRFYSVEEFTNTLGTENDDVTNTFTARLLLLLESCAIFNQEMYERIAKDVIRAYWRDFHDHESDFVPAFLTNDILIPDPIEHDSGWLSK